MYKFKETSNYEEFDHFVETMNESSFMQTSKWIPLKNTWTPHTYIGYNESNKIVLSALILERKLPIVGKIWYSPSGFICDYTNKNLIKEFTNYINNELKKYSSSLYIIDPQIIWRINDLNVDEANDKIDNLISSGFIYNVNRNEYTYQPPLTIALNLMKDSKDIVSTEELIKKFDKGIRYSIRVGEQRGLVGKQYTFKDIEANPSLYDDFLSVMNDTSKRVGFVTRPYEYYFDFMKQLSKWATIDLIYYDKKEDERQNIDCKQALLIAKEKLEKETSTKAITKIKAEITTLEKAIDAYHQRLQELSEANIYDERICVACGVTIRFNKEACCLFGGTRNILRNALRSSHYLNYLRIEKSITEGMKFHDLGRVTYDYLDADSPNHGLYKFKRSFASDKIEYIGEYILINNKIKYLIYSKVMPSAKKYKLEIVKMIKKIRK